MTAAESGYPAGSYRLNNFSYFLSERYTFEGRNFWKESKCCIRAATLLMAWWMWLLGNRSHYNRSVGFIKPFSLQIVTNIISSTQIAPVQLAVWMMPMMMMLNEIHGYRQWCTSNLHALMTWLNACQRSWDGVWLSRVCCSLTYSTLTHLRNFAEKVVWWLSQLLNVK